MEKDKKNNGNNQKIRYVNTLVLLDQDGNELIRHGINGIVLLAHPNQSEQALLPKDDGGHYPLISCQFGDPTMVLSLVQIFLRNADNVMTKWAKRMEEKNSEIILPSGGDKNGN